MKYLGKIIDDKDLVTKEYVDTTIPDISKYVKVSENSTVVPSNPIDANTLNGHPDTDFYKKTDTISVDLFGGYSVSSFVKKTDTIDANTVGGYPASDFLKNNNTINADTLNGKTDTDFVLKTDLINADTIDGYHASQFYKKGVNPVLDNDSIVDNLDSIDSTKVLSANQGRVLDEKIDSQISGLQTSIDGKLSKSGGTLTGVLVAQNNTSYTTKQVRNVFLSTSAPTSSDGANGDIWIVYTA